MNPLFDLAHFEIIRVLVGSTMYGTGLDGHEDTDYMAIAVEPPSLKLGLDTWETSNIRTAPEGVRSGPDDVDLVVHSLTKWAKLAVNGNPSILMPMYVPESGIMGIDIFGRSLRLHRHFFVTKKAGTAHLGYMQQQYERLIGIRGGKHTNRPELIEMFGFDTKYAMHMLRLGYQGIELMTEGEIFLPMKEERRVFLKDVRRGQYPLDQVLVLYHDLEAELIAAIDKADIPPCADFKAVSNLVATTYQAVWESRDE